jgi:putative tryptophan/tyrosine transport system substrate-binding protein
VRGVKRLALGAALILLACSILLLSDISRRASTTSHGAKHWKIYFILYNDVLDSEQAMDGARTALRENFSEGRDYEIKVLNAQGDMTTVSALIDAAVTDNANLIVTFSTPTLQAAIRRAGTTPVVYAYVANGLFAGAGKTETDHLPNITGVNSAAADREMMKLLREYFPGYHKLGTLFVPSEVNMVYQLGKTEKAASEFGFEIVSVPVSTATEVPDAAAALASRHIDAIMQIPGNLTVSAFSSISEAADRAHLPVFVFMQGQVRQGALVALARDFHDSGYASGLLAVRVMRGESPGNIPIEQYLQTSLIVNLDSARKLRMQLPRTLIKSAQEVISAANGNQQASTR